MPSCRKSSDSVGGGGAEGSDGQVDNTHPTNTNTSHSFTQDHLSLSSCTMSHSENTDENNLPLPDGIAAQIAYLDRRIDSLEANFRPNSRFLTHIDGLVTHINRVTTYLNIISANTDRRFSILTDAHTQHLGQVVASQTELEQRFDRRIEHQATRFTDQLETRAVDFRTRIDVTNDVLDQFTTTFNRLHVDDLSARVQSNSDSLQELSNRLTHISESVHQELENIRTNTHAAAATMSAQPSRQAPITTPQKDHESPIVEKQDEVAIGFTIKGAATRRTKATSSILDTPVEAEPFFTIATSSTHAPITTFAPTPQSSPRPPSNPATLDQETHALVMRNNIGLSKIMTSEDSYWAPRNIARRAAGMQAAAAPKPSLTDEQRTRLFQERLAKIGVRISAPSKQDKEVVEEKDDTEAYGSLDQFEQLLEEKSRCVSRAGSLDPFEQLQEGNSSVSRAGTEENTMREEQEIRIERKAEEELEEDAVDKERKEQQKVMREEQVLAIEQRAGEEDQKIAVKKERIQQIRINHEKRQLAIKRRAEEDAKEDATKKELIRQKLEKLGLPSDDEKAVKTITPTAMRETREPVVKRRAREGAKEKAATKERIIQGDAISQKIEKLRGLRTQWSGNEHAVKTATPAAVNEGL
ncbi:MAG: hypothetical protein Q9226_005312 [Calogaya cf. arnoldii]